MTYHTITATRTSSGGCGHIIIIGDRIGWDRAARRTRCAECQRRAAAKGAYEKTEKQYR